MERSGSRFDGDDRDRFLEYFEKVRERTMRVASCVPAVSFDWTWRPDRFTFADIVRHLASIERWMFVENAMLRPSRYPGHGKELADGRDAVLEFARALHAESLELLRSLPADAWNERCVTPGGAQLAVWKWLRLMIEHEIHHRGQLYLYAAMLGASAPPLYGLTEEEVKSKSADLSSS